MPNAKPITRRAKRKTIASTKASKALSKGPKGRIQSTSPNKKKNTKRDNRNDIAHVSNETSQVPSSDLSEPTVTLADPQHGVGIPGEQNGQLLVTLDRRHLADRRSGEDRRKEQVPVAVERRQLDRRAKVPRRRQIDPTTCERDYTPEEIEFMIALDEYKRTSGRMFPTCSEILEVIKKLGYEKRVTPPVEQVETTTSDKACPDGTNDTNIDKPAPMTDGSYQNELTGSATLVSNPVSEAVTETPNGVQNENPVSVSQ